MTLLCHGWNDDMRHDPVYITMQAREMVEQYGDYAESVAKDKMFACMQSQEIREAAAWMAIVQEVKEILRSSSGMN